MEIEVLSTTGCPNRATAVARLRRALRAIGEPSAPIAERVIDELDGAHEAGMHGSPTILLNGRDPFAPTGTVTSVSCRLHPSASGLDVAPSVEELITALSALAATGHRRPDRSRDAAELGRRIGADAGDGVER